MEAQKLDPEFKAKLLAALRSGEYKQGRTFLYSRSTGCHCVMGVAGEVLGIPRESIQGKCCPSELLGYPRTLTFDEDVITDPVNMNDDGKSFLEIADWIEANL